MSGSPKEAAILGVLFPQNVPVTKLDDIPEIKHRITDLVQLAAYEPSAATPKTIRMGKETSERISQRIIELRAENKTWEDVASIIAAEEGIPLTWDAVKHRHANYLHRQHLRALVAGRQNPTSEAASVTEKIDTAAEIPGLQEAEEPQVVIHPCPEIPIDERIEEVAEPAPQQSVSIGLSLSEGDLDGAYIQRLRDEGKGVKEIATILSVEMRAEVPWQAVRAKLAHMARMRKTEDAAPSCPKLVTMSAPEEAAEEKPQTDNAPGAPAGQSSTSPGNGTPQKAKYPDPKPISRANLEAMMLELHQQGMDPDEISEEICKRGYPRGPGTVKAWLGRLGVEL